MLTGKEALFAQVGDPDAVKPDQHATGPVLTHSRLHRTVNPVLGRQRSNGSKQGHKQFHSGAPAWLFSQEL